jgi:hypothetical protein
MSTRAKGFSSKDAQRVARVVQQVESTSWSGDPRRRVQDATYNMGTVRARVTTAVTSGSWSSPGTGQALIYHHDDDEWVAEDESVDVFNQYSLDGPIPVDTPCFLALISGMWFVQSYECPAED